MLKIARLQNLGAFKYDDPPTFVAMNTKDEKIAQFDPNGLAAPGALYGLPFDEVDAEVVVFPVPWEVTVSYGAGTARAAAAAAALSVAGATASGTATCPDNKASRSFITCSRLGPPRL